MEPCYVDPTRDDYFCYVPCRPKTNPERTVSNATICQFCVHSFEYTQRVERAVAKGMACRSQMASVIRELPLNEARAVATIQSAIVDHFQGRPITTGARSVPPCDRAPDRRVIAYAMTTDQGVNAPIGRNPLAPEIGTQACRVHTRHPEIQWPPRWLQRQV